MVKKGKQLQRDIDSGILTGPTAEQQKSLHKAEVQIEHDARAC